MANKPVKTEEAPAQQTVKMVLVPVDLYQMAADTLRDLPHRQADPILKSLSQCQIADVNVG